MANKPAKLTNPARAILAGLWGNPRFVLTYRNQDATASREARAALTELEAHGLIKRIITIDGAESFSLAPGVDVGRDYRVTLPFIAEHGGFPMIAPGGGQS